MIGAAVEQRIYFPIARLVGVHAISQLAPVKQLGQYAFMSEDQPSMDRPRQSASADAAFQAELLRVSQMTIKERVVAALTMRERFSWIQPTEVKPVPSQK